MLVSIVGMVMVLVLPRSCGGTRLMIADPLSRFLPTCNLAGVDLGGLVQLLFLLSYLLLRLMVL